MTPTPQRGPIRPRWTTGAILAAVALIAANGALVAQIVRDSGYWQLARTRRGRGRRASGSVLRYRRS